MFTKNQKSIFISSAVFALFIYISSIHRYSYNMPAGDDYDAVLWFLNQFVLSDPREKILLLFSQHNEHRILLTRLFSIADLFIFDQINFIHLIWFGTLGWILSIITFWHFSKKEGSTLIEFIPVIIIFLSFTHYEMMTWAMTSIQQYYQVFFALLSIGFLTTNRFLPSILFYICAMFTSGGGICLAPVISLYYFSKKKWGELTISLIINLIVFLCYFILLPYTSPSSSKILISLKHPFIFIGFIVGFVGSVGNIQLLGDISFLIFGFLLIFFFLFKAKKSYTQSPFLFWTCIYVFITAVLAALNRSDAGIAMGVVSRYSEYSLLFVASTYLIYASIIKKENEKTKVIFSTFFFSTLIFSYWYAIAIPNLDNTRHWLSNNLKTHPAWDHAKSIRAESVRLGIFHDD
jgi:hypothetical protein